MGGKPISGRDREAVLSAIRRNGDEGAEETPTRQQLMTVMKQMQSELVALKRNRARKRNGKNGDA